ETPVFQYTVGGPWGYLDTRIHASCAQRPWFSTNVPAGVRGRPALDLRASISWEGAGSSNNFVTSTGLIEATIAFDVDRPIDAPVFAAEDSLYYSGFFGGIVNYSGNFLVSD